ncbi:MAG: hypothetical protein WBR18_15960 [Anaerolineales bacterium]
MLLYPLWLIFAAIFFTFAFQHWRLSKRGLRPFRLREGEEAAETGKALQVFVEDWNKYLEDVNATYRDKHRVEMIGYTLTGLLAVVSMFMTLPS